MSAASHLARVSIDTASGRITAANPSAMTLTGRDLSPGTPWAVASARHPTLDGELDIWSDPTPRVEARVLQSARGPHAIFLKVRRRGGAIVLSFEPVDRVLAFANQLSDGVLATGALGQVLYANDPLRALQGGAAGAVPGAPMIPVLGKLGLDALGAEDMSRHALLGESLARCLEAGILLRRASIRTTPLQYRGAICGTVWVVRDLPVFGVPEPVLAHALARRMAALQQHEVRNPLQTARAAINLARDAGMPVPCDVLQAIDRNISRVEEAVVGGFSWPATPTCPGRLASAVAAAIADARRRQATHHLSFRHAVPPATPPVLLDRRSMAWVFGKLFVNTALARPDALVTVSYSWTERSVVCVVEDNGPGFPPRVLRGLPPPDPHEDLGLEVVRSIIAAHGGSIELASSEGGGARVILRLPVATDGIDTRSARPNSGLRQRT